MKYNGFALIVLILTSFTVQSSNTKSESFHLDQEFGVALIGELDYGGAGRRIQVIDNIAYVADTTRGLAIINVTDVENPSLIGTHNIAWGGLNVNVEDEFAYISNGKGVTILNVSDLTNVTEISMYETPYATYDIQIKDGFGYTSHQSDDLQVISVHDPHNPYFITNFDVPGYVYQIEIVGNYLFIANANFGIRIANISNPQEPATISIYPFENEGVSYFALHDHYAFLVTHLGVHIIDISDYREPAEVSFIGSGPGRSIIVKNDLLFLSSGGYDYIRIYNISNISSPEFLMDVPTTWLYNIQIVENHIFAIDEERGLLVFDYGPGIIPNFPTKTTQSTFSTSDGTISFSYSEDENNTTDSKNITRSTESVRLQINLRYSVLSLILVTVFAHRSRFTHRSLDQFPKN
jgi:hypothetical protein